jgi:hypothetical protein
MGSQMNFKSARPWVALPTCAAGIWLIPRVNQLMCLQMTLCDELLIAAFESADKGSLTSLFINLYEKYSYMCPQMSFQVACLRKLFQTGSKGTDQTPLFTLRPLCFLVTYDMSLIVKNTFIDVDTQFHKPLNLLLSRRKSCAFFTLFIVAYIVLQSLFIIINFNCMVYLSFKQYLIFILGS